MRNLILYIRIFCFTLLFFGATLGYSQTDPPENLYVTPVAMATWDSIQSDEFQFYKLFLNGAFVADTDSVHFQFGAAGEELVAGETYLAEIAALYNDGLSEKVGFEFVYLPCDSFPTHSDLNSYVLNDTLFFDWSPVEDEWVDLYLGTNFYFEDEFNGFIPAPDTHFAFPSPGPGYYDYCFDRVYSADNGVHSWESCPGLACINDAGYPWECNPPINLYADDELSGIHLSWEMFQQISLWLQYDDGVNVDAIGGPDDFLYGVRYTPAQLIDFEYAQISSVKFFISDTLLHLTLKMWQGQDGDELMYEQEITDYSTDQWNTIQLNSPYLINNNDALTVGFRMESPNYSAGCGNFTGNPNSDLVSIDNGVTWEHLNDYGLPYNWNLALFIENSVSNPLMPDGYYIYKNDELLNEELITNTYYHDTDIIDNQEYCYQVTAYYNECGESDPSNEACAGLWWAVEELETQAHIYPNPAQQVVKIESSFRIRSIYVYHSSGKLCNHVQSVNSSSTQLDVSGLSNGVYFLQIENDSKIDRIPLIIQK